MSQKNSSIELGPVQRTLLLPLWARANETERDDPVIIDSYAKEVVRKSNYDFSVFEKEISEMEQINFAVRAFNFDNEVLRFIDSHPDGLVINIGAGLDTTFRRVDNKRMCWVNLDLPDAIAFRRRFIADAGRETTIGKSVFDYSWVADIAAITENRAVLFMAAGVLFYFQPGEVKTLFITLSQMFPKACFVFDTMPWLLIKAANLEIKRKKLTKAIPLFGWHLNRTAHLKKWLPSIKIVDEYPMYALVRFRKEWSKNVTRPMKIMDFFRWYSMNCIQF